MTANLPAINSANPIAGVLIGWAVFDERFRVGVAPTAAKTLRLAVIVIATGALSRRSVHRSRSSFSTPRSQLSPGDHGSGVVY
jgi:hypothetical protein